MHIDENDIARYVDGRLTDETRRDIEVHLAECPQCRNRVAAVHQTLEDIPEQDAPMLPSEARRQAERLDSEEPDERDVETGPRRRSTAIAGTVVLLLGIVGLLYWQFQGPAPSRLRSSSADAPELAIRAPADGATVSERPTFVCSPVSNALSYRITLKTPDGTVVWKGDTTATRVHLPADVSLADGNTYLWRAEALRSDGTRLRSTLRTFTYDP